MTTTERTYPYKGWVLQPSFKPVEVEFVSAYRALSREDYGDRSTAGKVYARSEIHATKADAIAFGRAEIVRMQADIDKRQSKLSAKSAALNKADGA